MPTVLNFCPYLPLRSELTIGPWRLTTAPEYSGPWLSAEFEEASRLFLTHFHGPDRVPVAAPTLIAHVQRGIDGAPLIGSSRDALQGALDFCILDAAPRWEEEESSGSMSALLALTADNTELFVWPVDSEGGWFVVDSGLLVSTLSGGHHLDNSNDIITCPVEVRVPRGAATGDEEVATVLHDALFTKGDEGNARAALAARLTTALRWWARAHRNTRSITWEDRIVMLKTAFEALLEESRAWPGACRLRELFESRVEEPGGELCWSPDEEERYTIRLDGKDRSVTPLQHWFVEFAFLRNAIVHEGTHITESSESYQEEGPYQGPFFHRADEVFRQAIKVMLTDFGTPNLWHSALTRTIARAIEDARGADESGIRSCDDA